jgi:hypothetical protein
MCGCWSVHRSATKALTYSIIWFVVSSFLNSVLLFCLGYLLPNWYSVSCITHFSRNLLLNYILSSVPWVCTGSDCMWPKMQWHSWLVNSVNIWKVQFYLCVHLTLDCETKMPFWIGQNVVVNKFPLFTINSHMFWLLYQSHCQVTPLQRTLTFKNRASYI